MEMDKSFLPIGQPLNVLLVDDDVTDCLLFKEALGNLPITVNLTTVHDGDQLMNLLMTTHTRLPDVLFLDLHMPKKNGYAVLGLLKRELKLLQLPVIIFSAVSEA